MQFVALIFKYKDTYIFIFGDHSIICAEDDFLFKPAALEYKANYARGVPLFIITPDNREYIEDKAMVSLLDVGPTVLYASGINFEITTRGINLLNIPVSENQIPLKHDTTGSRRDMFNIFKGIIKE